MVYGSFMKCPLVEWVHVSPLMSQPKGEPDENKKEEEKRRVTLDLSFPLENSIYAFIFKGAYMGKRHAYVMPTVDQVVEAISDVGQGAYMFMLDIERAYKNFLSCPLFWPLLTFRWRNEYYIDISLPFGSRICSLHMQTIADLLVKMVTEEVHMFMYLDDMIAVGKEEKKVKGVYEKARNILQELGLPEAKEKLQAPQQRVKWLGIWFDSSQMSIEMPEEKILATQAEIRKYAGAAVIPKKKLQSIIGRVLNLGKCIPPARLLIGRLLSALKGKPKDQIQIDSEINRDFDWLLALLRVWNGRTIMRSPAYNTHIWIHADMNHLAA